MGFCSLITQTLCEASVDYCKYLFCIDIFFCVCVMNIWSLLFMTGQYLVNKFHHCSQENLLSFMQILTKCINWINLWTEIDSIFVCLPLNEQLIDFRDFSHDSSAFCNCTLYIIFFHFLYLSLYDHNISHGSHSITRNA